MYRSTKRQTTVVGSTKSSASVNREALAPTLVESPVDLTSESTIVVELSDAIEDDKALETESSTGSSSDKSTRVGKGNKSSKDRRLNWSDMETEALIDAVSSDYAKLIDKNISNNEKGLVWTRIFNRFAESWPDHKRTKNSIQVLLRSMF
jgi:hypothetical protein